MPPSSIGTNVMNNYLNGEDGLKENNEDNRLITILSCKGKNDLLNTPNKEAKMKSSKGDTLLEEGDI